MIRKFYEYDSGMGGFTSQQHIDYLKKELKLAEQEINRLKALIKEEWMNTNRFLPHAVEISKRWQQFKTENNL